MFKSKKVLSSFSLVILLSSLLSCSSAISPASVNNAMDAGKVRFNKLVQELSSRGKTPYIVDMRNGKGTSFAVNIKIKDDQNFKLKSAAVESASGHRFVGSDIDMVKVFIFADNTFSSGAAIMPDASMPSGAEITLNTKTGTAAGGTFDVVFTNVPGDSDAWRVAITALTTQAAAVGSSSSPRNITLGSGATSYGTYNSENYAVSNLGGDSDSGAVLIDATDLTLTGTTALSVPLELIPADGATIGSTATVTNGSSVPVGSVSAS
jgi:hypothetical protein